MKLWAQLVYTSSCVFWNIGWLSTRFYLVNSFQEENITPSYWRVKALWSFCWTCVWVWEGHWRLRVFFWLHKALDSCLWPNQDPSRLHLKAAVLQWCHKVPNSQWPTKLGCSNSFAPLNPEEGSIPSLFSLETPEEIKLVQSNCSMCCQEQDLLDFWKCSLEEKRVSRNI